MRRALLNLAFAGLFAAASPGYANILVELSFPAKMAASDVVIVGTVTSVSPGNSEQADSTATVMTLATLKGVPEAQHIVFTHSLIAEDDPQCCEVGATYVMFLGRVPNRSELVSVNGRHGMVKIGPADNEPRIQVIQDSGSR